MTTAPTPSQAPLSAGAVPELPVVGYLDQTTSVFSFHRFDPAITLTPRDPAKATINAQAAEIERLKRERDEASRSAQQSALNTNYNAEIALRHGAELGDLKAKQVAEADEVMALAEKYAAAKSEFDEAYRDRSRAPRLRNRHDLRVHVAFKAAREALRAAVTKDRT